MKKISIVITCISIIGIMWACSNDDAKIKIKEITLPTESLALNIGDTEILTAVTQPGNASDEIEWVSLLPAVASVDQSGMITANMVGSTQIIARAGLTSDTCLVTVRKWTTYTTEDGLVHNTVNAIAIDSHGTKWFGTDGGVSKFDGATWTNYTTTHGLADNKVYSVAIDSDDVKWFGTLGGLSKFDGTNWTTYSAPTQLGSNVVLSIAIDSENTKWIGTIGGLSKFNGNDWTKYTANATELTSNTIIAIAIENGNKKWMGTDNGVSYFDNTDWTRYLFPNALTDNQVMGAAVDATTGTKWFGTYTGVSKFDGTTWVKYSFMHGVYNGPTTVITAEPSGTIWLGCGMGIGGLTQFKDDTFTVIKQGHGLPTTLVQSIAVDANNHKWFGTFFSGVVEMED